MKSIRIILTFCFIILLTKSTTIVPVVNYGLYLGSIPNNSLDYNWIVNFVVNADFASPVLPTGKTSAQYVILNGWTSPVNITLATSTSMNSIWTGSNQVGLLISDTTPTIEQIIALTSGKYALQFEFAQSSDSLLGAG